MKETGGIKKKKKGAGDVQLHDTMEGKKTGLYLSF